MAEALHIFTSAAVNYLPKVRILCRSIRRHHPEAVIHFALADERPEWLRTDGEPFDDILDIARLDIPDWRVWTFTHSIVELATAIKPFALRHLLNLPGCETVLYFNLGFIGVRNAEEGRRFASWWAERTYHLCRAEVQNGLFTDQKWLNFAPVFFDGVAIIKSSRHNVATWNLTTRHMTGDFETGFEVDGEPLGFYHFTGFDSGAHRIMAIKNASESRAVQEMISWYDRETAVAESDPVSQWPWAFGRFSDGTPIEACHRWLYREHRDLQKAFPDPYDARRDQRTFLGWCKTEGKLRYPQFFTVRGGCAAVNPIPPRASVSFAVALRLFVLMLAPASGKALRARVFGMLRSEGLGGFAKRLHGPRQ
jgi:hypothetical protein